MRASAERSFSRSISFSRASLATVAESIAGAEEEPALRGFFCAAAATAGTGAGAEEEDDEDEEDDDDGQCSALRFFCCGGGAAAAAGASSRDLLRASRSACSAESPPDCIRSPADAARRGSGLVIERDACDCAPVCREGQVLQN